MSVRFLQVQARGVQERTAEGWHDVEHLLVGDTRWVPFSEAVPREVHLGTTCLDAASRHDVVLPGGREVEAVAGGRLVRRRWPLRARLEAEPVVGADPGLRVLRLTLTNLATWPGTTQGRGARDVAARTSLVGTHLLLTARGGALLSLLDPPARARADAARCRQDRCWPVLVSEDDGRDAVLVAPIVLGDHPRIAPESVGDLFDATEIDEILTLRVQTMTEDEKAAARGTDPRAAEILARCDALQDAALAALHGARRDEPVWPGWGDEVEPEADSVVVAGVPLRRGSRVRLRPSRRADAQDVFLAGQVAVVARVYGDLDGRTHLAVTLEDDPAADLYDVTGRYYYFGPEELEPLPAEGVAR